MRVASSDGLSARILLAATLTLIFFSAPPAVHADSDDCSPMSSKMQSGYRAMEDHQYAVASQKFAEAAGLYTSCAFYQSVNPKGDPATVPLMFYWGAYADAGQAAAAFGQGKTTDGLKFSKTAKDTFNDFINGKGFGERASESLRRSASDGLAYVRALESAKQPHLPKIWLDWKVAHP